MMDPSNRVNPDEVLDGTKLHEELEALQKEKAAELDALTRAERRQEVLDQRALRSQQAARARNAMRRGLTPQRRIPTTGSGRRR